MENEVKTGVAMGCFEHPDKTVVATCPKCGKFMCKECAEKYKSKLCETCEKESIENQKAQVKNNAKVYKEESLKELIKVAVVSLALGVLGFCIASSEGTGQAFTMAWLLAGFPWGWKIINRLMDGNMMTWFIVLTDKFWIVAYVIKFALAFMIGAVLWPFKLGISIYHFISAKKLENNINK